jgi:hypothetical protein
MRLGHDEVAEDPGDDSAVLRAYLHWTASAAHVLAADAGPHPLCCVQRQNGEPDGLWELVLSIGRASQPPRRQRLFVAVDPSGRAADLWPMVRLAPGVWDLPKSIHAPGQFHGFVTLLGVPDPAPWEANDA